MTSVIGHRGAPRVEVENTLASFAAAADLGADGVELDVRRTADGLSVVHHDPALADGRALVHCLAADLPTHIPTLAAVLAQCEADDLDVNIEIKSMPAEIDFDPDYAVVEDVVAQLSSFTDAHRARLLISSFDPKCLRRVRALDESLATALLTIDALEPEPVVHAAAVDGHVAINPHYAFVTEHLVAVAREHGLAVYPWTVDKPRRIAPLLDLEVDGIITNVPDVVRTLVDTPP